jgi:hypothetical protein
MYRKFRCSSYLQNWYSTAILDQYFISITQSKTDLIIERDLFVISRKITEIWESAGEWRRVIYRSSFESTDFDEPDPSGEDFLRAEVLRKK